MNRPGRQLLMGALLLSAVAGSPGCKDTLATAASVAQYTFKIPPGRPARPKLSADDAALVYPDVEHLGRDPFLTLAEEAQYDHKDVPVDDKTVVAVNTEKKHRHHEVVDKVISQLKAQVHNIVLGRHNTFIYNDKYYEEGDTIDGSEWKVISINEAHIKLQTLDGKQQQQLNFGRDSGGTFEITPSH